MEIVLNKKYSIKSDPRQYILIETIDEKKNMWYYSSLKELVKSLIKRKVRMDKDIKTLKDLSEKIDFYADELSKQIQK